MADITDIPGEGICSDCNQYKKIKARYNGELFCEELTREMN